MNKKHFFQAALSLFFFFSFFNLNVAYAHLGINSNSLENYISFNDESDNYYQDEVSIDKLLNQNPQSRDVLINKEVFHNINSTLLYQENKGQILDTDGKPRPDILFTSYSKGVRTYFKKDGISYVFEKHNIEEKEITYSINDNIPTGTENAPEDFTVEMHRIDLNLIGTSNNVEIIKDGRDKVFDNFYLGDIRAEHVYSYEKVTYKNIYPNVDMVLYTKNGGMKYDFIVRPGGDPDTIKFKIDGTSNTEINKNGELVIKSHLGEIIEGAPIVLQANKTIKSTYQLNNNVLSFNIDNYNPNETLIIDPTRDWGTYYTASNGGHAWDYGMDEAASANGVYWALNTYASSYPVSSGVFDPTHNGGYDIRIVHFDTSGSLVWGTYFGSNGNDVAPAIANGPNNTFALSGTTNSANFPTTSGAFDQTFNGGYDYFISQWNGLNGTLNWSTYFGSVANDDFGNGIDVNNNGEIAFLGMAYQSFPLINPLDNSLNGGRDNIVAKFADTGNLVWSTYFGGNSNDFVSRHGVKFDNSGNVIISGRTQSQNLPVTSGAFDSYNNGYYDLYLASISNDGSTLNYCTYIGDNNAQGWPSFYQYGGGDRNWHALAVCSDNSVIVGGVTWGGSNAWAYTSGAYSNIYGGAFDSFILKLNDNGNRLWGTNWGGNSHDWLLDVEVDEADNVFVLTATYSINLPVTADAHQQNSFNSWDMHIAQFSADGSNLLYGSYLASPGHDVPESGGLTYYNGDLYCGFPTNYNSNNPAWLVSSGAYQTNATGGTYYPVLNKFHFDLPITCAIADATNDSENPLNYTAAAGFTNWSGSNTGSGGYFVGSSTSNGDGDGNNDGDINTNNKSWGLWANSGGVSNFSRNINDPLLTTGDTFSINLDNGWIDTGGSVGFGLQNASDENILEFYFRGGEPHYIIHDGSGEVDTGIGFTDEGLNILFTLTSATTYDLVVTELATNTPHNYSGNLIAPSGAQYISKLRLFNANAGNDGERNAFFNSIESCTLGTATDNDNDGYSSEVDCNDNEASINPGADEICNGVDDNCDGDIDENPAQVDFANLQFWSSDSTCDGESLTAYGQVYEQGLTDGQNGQAQGIAVQFGYYTDDIDPATWPGGNWNNATFNIETSTDQTPGNFNNDEYLYTFTPSGVGVYYYTFRYSLNGCDWQYGGTNNGFWNGNGNDNGMLTVTEQPTWYADFDNDGFGDPNDSLVQCDQPSNYVANSNDICVGYDDNVDTDNDGDPDGCDPDDDNDGCLDGDDPNPLDFSVDTDGDGIANDCDDDDDNDGINDNLDPNSLDPFICGDADGDTCDDCSVGTDGFGPQADNQPNNDGVDTDSDGICDSGDPDDDNDGIADALDPNPLNPNICGDSDNDGCDDCSNGVDGFGPQADNLPSNDGTDTDGDGLCDSGDPDDDNDGIADASDPNPLDPFICGDADGDTCDDCSNGVDGFGPQADNLPSNDGTDTDGDGLCDSGDPDDDNDGCLDGDDPAPLTASGDTDNDSIADDCDTCPNDPDNDIDGDGVCGDLDNCPSIANPGQGDSDNDGIGDLCDTEECDGVDNDGDGDIDEGFDSDNDGIADCFDTEECDGLDNDGDGLVDLDDPSLVDNEAPNALCKDISIELDASGSASITTAMIDNGSTDNCGIVSKNIDKSTFDCSNLSEPGAAASFSSTTDYINIGTSSLFSTPSQLSIEAWIFPTGNGSHIDAGGIIVNKEGQYEIARFADGSIKFAISTVNNPNWYWIPANISAPLNQWSHIALTYNNSSSKVYLNGNLVFTTNELTGAIRNNPSFDQLRIGGRQGANQNFHGNIDEVRLWDTAITDTEVASQYNTTINAPQAGLIGYWSLDEGSGNTTVDKSGNGNNGTFVNQTGWVTPGAISSSSNVVTLTVIDAAGNQSTCTANVTVEDKIAPEITCPANIDEFATSAAGATVTWTAPIGTDNCTATTTQTSGLPSGSTFPIGPHTISYEVTDESGNTNSCSFTVTVTGLAPVISCPNNIIVNNDVGQCGAVVTFEATDAVGIPASTITYSPASGTFFPVGTTTVTATATNAVDTSICMFDVTVNDNENPTISCPSDVTINCQDDTSVAANGEATGSDNCSAVSITFSDVSSQDGDASAGGHYNYTITRTWTATDVTGNSISCDQIINIEDSSAPTISCPSDVTISCEDDTSVAANSEATGTDNCSAVSITFSDVSSQDGDASAVGHYNYEITRTWTATDVTGNSTSCDQVITVQDVTNPDIDCPANVTLECDTETSPVVTGEATGSDICSDVTITYTDSSTQSGGGGSSNAVWINEIHYDNASTDVGELVEVVSNFDATGYSIVLYNGSNGTSYNTSNLSSVSPTGDYYFYTISYPTNGLQNGSPDGIALVNTSSNVVQFLSYEGSFTATNGPANGLTSTDIGVSEPGAVGTSLQLNGSGSQYSDFTWSGPATATAGAANTSQTLVSGGVLPPGYYNYTITRTWTATDVTGNSISCDQIITIEDSTAPTISCPSDVTISCEDDTSVAANGEATGTDNCSAVSITFSDVSSQDGDASAVGHYNYEITRTWTATDVTGNSTSCDQVITVQDVTNPDIDCPANVTLECDTETSPVVTGEATGSDICSDVTITYTDSSTQSGGGGSSNAVWINEIHYDNASTDVGELVEVVSNFDATGYSIVLYNGSNGTSYNTSNLSSVSPTGDYYFYTISYPTNGLQNGSPDGIALVNTSSNVVQFLSYEGSFTATNGPANGLTSTDIGVSEPGAVGTSLQLNGSGSQYSDFTWSGPATATAGAANTSQTLVSGGALPPGYYNYTITRTWTATDVTGNSISCDQIITIEDSTAPTISCPSDVTISCEDDTSVAANGEATGTDNCSAVSITFSDVSSQDGDASAVGHYNYEITRTWTATDVTGNSVSCDQIITVQDITNPEIACPGDVTIECDVDTSPTINGEATGTDICSDVTITYTDSSTQSGGGGSSNAVWINEIHYDNASTDVGELVEVVSNFDATGYSIVLYNGSNGTSYNTSNLSSVSPTGDYYFYTISYPTNGLQNGSPDGIALVNTSSNVVQFLSYEGSFTATNGPANGLTSTDIGVSEPGAVGTSLQLNGSGSQYSDFTWSGPATATAGAANTSQTLVSGGALPPGYYNYTITRTWTATDVTGNSISCDQIINVEDSSAPTISCPSDVTISCEDDTSVAANGEATGTDNCSAVSITFSDVSSQDGDASAVGHYNYEITRTWTATDVTGNSISCDQIITVQDITSPEIDCPVDVTINCEDDTTSSSNGLATGTDNCDQAVAITESDSSTYNADPNSVLHYNYVITRTWTVTDVAGNSTSCDQIITVQDVTNPTISDVADVTINCEDDTSSSANSTATGDDICSDVTITESDVSTQDANAANIGHYNYTITRTWRATDVTGNYTESIQVITVQDITPPVVDCIELTIQLNANGDASITPGQLDNSSDDNCSPVSLSISQTNFSCADIGGDYDALVISEYTDGTGLNKAIEIFNGTGLPVNLSGEGYQLLIYPNGGGSPVLIPLLGVIQDRDVYVIGNTFASSGIGNQTDYLVSTLNFNGNDAIALVKSTGTVDYIPAATWTENVTLVRTDTIEGGNIIGDQNEWISNPQDTFDDLGSHDIIIDTNNGNNVLLTVTDVSGNSSTCEATVIVQDVTPPVVVCNEITVELDANGAYNLIQSNYNDLGEGSSDACGIASITATPNSFTCTDVGSNTVIVTVTDKNGLSSTCTTTVTVEDNVAPEAICQDITIQLDAAGTASIVPSDIDGGSSDACGFTLAANKTTFDCSNVGTNTVILTVTDANNNTDTCTATVTVEDNVAPEAICQNITVQLDATGNASIAQDAVNNSSTDACEGLTFATDITDFTCANVGSPVTVVLTVTDANGNTDTCTATVTVEGIIPTVSITEAELPPFCQGAFVILTANADVDVTYLWSTGETTQSIEVDTDDTYSVTVTSSTGCTAEESHIISGFDESELLSSYTILAQNEVFLHGSNLVQSGGVGATSANGLIKLHQASQIVGFGRAVNFTLNQGSTIGNQIQQIADIPFPAFEYNTLSNNNSPDVTINNNQSQILNGSVYGRITVRQNATVTFSQENVYIDDLRTFDGASIEFDGCANVFINEKFFLAQNGTINANGNNVVMYVNEDVQIEKGSYVRARIHSNGNELLAKGANGNGGGNNSAEPTEMIGLFIAKKVHGSTNVIWNADDLCAPCAISEPAQTTAAPAPFGTGPDSDVVAWPNPSKSTFNIKLLADANDKDVEIAIFDMSNKLVHANKFKPNEDYNFGNELEGGVYIVKISHGGKVRTVRLVKY